MNQKVPVADDAVAALNRLFVAALTALARAGEAEQACRLAARGWSTLRHANAREAERLNAALHGLVRVGSVSLSSDRGAENG